MCFYIGIEDLAANALIELLRRKETQANRFLSYSEIEDYGSRVIQLLTSKGEKAVLILSRESTDAMFRNYSDFFEEGCVEGSKGIKLRTGIEVDQLIEEFRGYLALDVLMAFTDEESIQALGA